MSDKVKQITMGGLSVWLICALFYMYAFLLRPILGTFEEPITQDLHINLFYFSLLSATAFQITYSIMQIPVGMIAEKIGLKMALVMGGCTTTAGVFLLSISETFSIAFIARMLMGFGASFGFIGVLMAVYEWMPQKNMALFIGLSLFIGTVGPMVASGPLFALYTNFNITWQKIFWLLTLIGIAITLAVIFIVREQKQESKALAQEASQNSIFIILFHLLAKPQIWLIILLCSAIFFPISYLSTNTGHSYLVKQGFKPDVASTMLTIAWLGFACGSPVMGQISDYIQKRKTVITVSVFILIISFIIIVYWPINHLVTFTAFFFLGLGASGNGAGFAILADHCNHYNISIAMGLNNSITFVFLAVFSPVIGVIISFLADGNVLTLTDYQHAYSYLVLTLIILFIFTLFFLKETYCNPAEDAYHV